MQTHSEISNKKAEERAGIRSKVDVRLFQLNNNGYSIKKHWNTINIDRDLPIRRIKKMIDMSYDLVVKSLPKREREGI